MNGLPITPLEGWTSALRRKEVEVYLRQQEVRDTIYNMLSWVIYIPLENLKRLMEHSCWSKLSADLGNDGYKTMISLEFDAEGWGELRLGKNSTDTHIKIITFSSSWEIHHRVEMIEWPKWKTPRNTAHPYGRGRRVIGNPLPKK